MTIFEKSNVLKVGLSSSRKKKRAPGPSDFDKPIVDSPTLLGATDDDEGNQVHSQDQGLAMTLKFANLPAGSEPNNTRVRVQAVWNGTLVGNVVEGRTPLPVDWADDKTLIIPANYTNQKGQHEIKYRVEYGLNPKFSDPETINVDTDPPVLASDVGYPAEIKTNGFTAEYFEDVSPHALLTYTNTYNGAKTDDGFEFWIGKLGSDGKPTADSTLVETIKLVSPRQPLQTTKLTRALIKVDEGTLELFALVDDRKGNRSLASPVVTVPVSMIPMPRDFTVQVVKEHGDVTDRTILFRDAQVPVFAEHKFLNWKTGDKLRVSIGSQPAKDLDILADPNVTPFRNTITYKELFDDGNLNLKDLDYKYQVHRGTKLIPDTPILQKLKVHLEKPGEQPDDPDNIGLPGSPDPKLNLVNVRGVFLRDNYLIKPDASVGALARFKIYKGHKAKDEIEVHYHGVPLLTVLELDGSETDDTILEALIPPDYISAGGNNKQMRVGYTVYHRDVNETTSVSVDQLVDVYVNEIPMPSPLFKVTGDPGNGDGETVYCGSLIRHPTTNAVVIETTLTPDAKFVGKEITFFIQGFENVDDAGVNKPGAAIPGAIGTVVATMPATVAGPGWSAYFPHEIFQEIFNGWCEITCSTEQDGYSTPSDPQLNRVTMDYGDGTYCDLPSPLIR